MSEYERQYEDGSDPRVLDIIEVPVLAPQPEEYQAENWLLDPEFYWRRQGRYSALDLGGLMDAVEPLWLDGRSTYNGENDTVPLRLLSSVTSSLRLIRVAQLDLVVFAPGEAFGNSKRRVQGRFLHADRSYRLWVTDPIYERNYLAKLDGTYPVGPCYLTISLGEPYEGASYKLIAAIIGLEKKGHE